MYPFFGERHLADITNLAMKEFVDHISALKPATIRDYVCTVKAVVASARDIKGEPLFMRDWDDGFIDVPEVDEQNQPTVDQDEMEMILREAEEPYCTCMRCSRAVGRCGPGKHSASTFVPSMKISAPWRLCRKPSAESFRTT